MITGKTPENIDARIPTQGRSVQDARTYTLRSIAPRQNTMMATSAEIAEQRCRYGGGDD